MHPTVPRAAARRVPPFGFGGMRGGSVHTTRWFPHPSPDQGLSGSDLALEQTPGASEGQGTLACYSPWGRKESEAQV